MCKPNVTVEMLLGQYKLLERENDRLSAEVKQLRVDVAKWHRLFQIARMYMEDPSAYAQLDDEERAELYPDEPEAKPKSQEFKLPPIPPEGALRLESWPEDAWTIIMGYSEGIVYFADFKEPIESFRTLGWMQMRDGEWVAVQAQAGEGDK